MYSCRLNSSSFVAKSIVLELTPLLSWPLQVTNGSPVFHILTGSILALHPPRCEPPNSGTIIKRGLSSSGHRMTGTRFGFHVPFEGPWLKHFPPLKSHYVICKNTDWGLGMYLSGYGPCQVCVRSLGSVLRITNTQRERITIKVTFHESQNAVLLPWNNHGVHTY